MKKHSLLSLPLSLICMFSVLFFTSEAHAQASLDPIISNSPIPCTNTDFSLDVTDGCRDAAMLLVDPTDLASLALTTARCSNPGNPALYGLTVGTMYCVKSYISNATHIYAAGLNNTNHKSVFGVNLNYFVTLYQGACLTLGVALFGLRMMAMQMENPTKEIFTFAIKLGFTYYLITQAPTLYDTLVNGIGEGISWVTTTLALTNVSKNCFLIDTPLKTALTTVDPSVNYDEYQVWHMIDCMFLRIFGAAFPDNLSISVAGFSTYTFPTNVGQDNLVYASALPVIGAALFTSTVGISGALLGLSAFTAALELVMKGMFLVLSSFLTISLFCLMTPFFAPLLLFETHRNDSYPMRIFSNWLGVLIGAIIQPIIILGYLSFAALLLDALIEGDTSTDPVIAGLFTNCGTPDAPGTGICSVQQLFHPFPDWTTGGIPTVGAIGDYNWEMNINPVIAHMKVAGDPQLASQNCTMVDRTLTYLLSMANDQLNQVEAKAQGAKVTGPAQLKTTQMRLMRLTITFVCFIIIAVVLYQLMDVIPEMAQGLGGGLGINFWKGMTVPFIDIIKSGISGAEGGVAASKGDGLFSLPRTGKVLDRAVSQMGKMLTGR